jgi:hypothetical protein
MRCLSPWLLLLLSSAKAGAGMHREYRGTICQKSLGNPAIIGETPRQIGGFASRSFERFALSASTARMPLNAVQAKEFGSKR